MKVCRNAYRSDLYLCDLGHIFFVIYTVPEDIAKVPQCSFESICGPLFLRLFKGRGLSFCVFDMTVTDVLSQINE